MTVKLSKRLAEIAGRLSGSGFDLLADIGSDHALLPIHAVKRGPVPEGRGRRPA